MVIWKVLHLKNPQRRNFDLQDPFGQQIQTALLSQISLLNRKKRRVKTPYSTSISELEYFGC